MATLASRVGTQECGVSFFGSVGHALWHVNDYAMTGKGSETIFKVGYHIPAIIKATGVELSPEALAFESTAKSLKLGVAAIGIPKSFFEVGKSVSNCIQKPSAEKVYKIVDKIAGTVNPSKDLIDLLNKHEITHFSPETMKILGQVGAGALAFVMGGVTVYDVIDEVEAIGVWGQSKALDIRGPAAPTGARGEVVAQQSQVNMEERAAQAWRKAGLILLDIIKAVSYVALATIALLAAFIVAIPNAGLLILACSTSALFFTLFNEFAGRSYKEYVEAAFAQVEARVAAAAVAGPGVPPAAAPGAPVAAPAPAALVRTPEAIDADRAALAAYRDAVRKADGKPMKLPFLPVVSA